MSHLPLPIPPPGPTELLALYRQMVLLRRFELTVQEAYKRGRMPGFIHLYIGQEAVAAGIGAHLRPTDWMTSTHRGHGHALAKGVPARAVLAELYGKRTGCCGGRGGSMHLYDAANGLLGTNGFVGGGIPAAVGAALSVRAQGRDGVAVAFFGDGAINHGAFHESLNFAAVQAAPVVFVCENNLYATATPLSVATRSTDVAARAAAYGLPGVAADGNDVVAMWQAMRTAVERARRGEGPTLIEARTYRMVGHHEGDPLVGTYRTQEELEVWKARCPIRRLRQSLLDREATTEAELTSLEAAVEQEVREALEFAEASELPLASTAGDHAWSEPVGASGSRNAGSSDTREQTWLEAVRDGIAEEMRRDPGLLYLGEGIGERGGSFAHTRGLWQEFGPGRVIDTPISELGFTGAAMGAAATGCRAVADLMFTDFLFEAASQIIEQAGKLRYMSNGQLAAPVVLRSGMGAIKNAGPHHSGTYYPIWAHCPGLIVVVPSHPADAKGLFKTALRSGDPVLMLEHKALFASKGPVPVGEHLVPFGQATVRREGTQLTVITCGLMVGRSLEAAERLAPQGISCEVIDLRTVVPLDVEAIVTSVTKTGRALVVDEAFAMCGLGGEIAAVLMEHAFDALDAPVGRLHTEPVAHPFSPSLENAITISVEKIVAAAQSVLAGHAPIPRRAPALAHRSSSFGMNRVPGSSSKGGRPPIDAPTPVAEGVPVVMPNQDLTVTEATVVRWLKREGEPVAQGDSLVEVETAKSVFPVESPATGRLGPIEAGEGIVVQFGQRLASIRS